MSSPITKQVHEQPPRQALCTSTTRPRYRNPLVVFVVVLIVVLGFRRIYELFATSSLASFDNNGVDIQTIDTYDEDQLQEVAALMDEIYTILANTSFIPHDSIQRGPHQINTTASICKLDAADLRLMEILPYINTTLSGRSSWLWGGLFVDYRRNDHLEYDCDLSWVETDPLYIMRPGVVHLTRGGWDGSDLYRTWKLQYDTRKHAMRIYEGEEWWPYSEMFWEPSYTIDEYRPGYSWNDLPISSEGNTTGRQSINRHSRDWTEWTDAPTFLKRIRDAYLSTAWSPWETSNPENQRNILPSNITSALLLKNGWPDRLDVNQFKVDSIRAQHKPSGQGWAEGAFRHIKNHQYDLQDMFNLHHKKKHLRYFQSKLVNLEKGGSRINGHAMWSAMLQEESTRHEIERQERDFEDAKRLIQRSCRNHMCVEQEDLILWEFRQLEKTYTKAQLEPDTVAMCEDRGLLPDQLSRCISQLSLERYWLQLAYEQSRADAYTHCARNRKLLLPPASFETLASHWIAEYERDIARYDNVFTQLDAWQERTGASDSTTEYLRKEYRSAKAWDTRLCEGRIEEIERSLAGRDSDEDRLKLWDRLETFDPPRSQDSRDNEIFY